MNRREALLSAVGGIVLAVSPAVAAKTATIAFRWVGDKLWCDCEGKDYMVATISIGRMLCRFGGTTVDVDMDIEYGVFEEISDDLRSRGYTDIEVT